MQSYFTAYIARTVVRHCGGIERKKMLAYGTSKKGMGKLHPANECASCGERKPPCKRRDRNNAKKEISQDIAQNSIPLRQLHKNANEQGLCDSDIDELIEEDNRLQ